MAAPSYTTDLTTIATGDLNVDAGTWDESGDAGWDTGGAMVDDENLYYNDTECVSAQMTRNASGSGTTGPATIFYEHTSNITIPTDGAALIHHMWAAPPALNTIDNATSAGINICAGSDLDNFYAWKASGSDFFPAPKGGWTTYAINPAIGSPDHTVGTAPTTYAMIGVGVSATAQARGNPNACNAVRYGRCESRFTNGDVTNGYATFTGFGAVDATSTNKWSLLDPIEGGFKFQGLMSLGLTATSVDFRDANANIVIANTINVTSAFNAIEVHHASSNVEWTAVNISALGTNSIGTFEVVDNATVELDTCTFTDMGTFDFLSNTTTTNTTFRRCDQITGNGATITGGTVEGSTNSSAVFVDTALEMTDITGVSFVDNNSAPTNAHSIELTATGTHTFTDITFSGGGGTPGSNLVASSGSATADVYNNSGGAITINVTGGDTPSVRNAAGSTTTVTVSVPVTVTIVDKNNDPILGVSVGVFLSSNDTEVLNTTSNASGVVSGSYGGSTPASVYIRARDSSTGSTRYIPASTSGTIESGTGLSATIVMIKDTIVGS